jgi:hypothetical protein
VSDLTKLTQKKREQISLAAEVHNESTGASWFWALLFGPLYYARFGFWGRAIIILALNFAYIGFIISPLIVYQAWRSRAYEIAKRDVLLTEIKNAD